MEKITLRGFLICFLFNLLLSQNIFSQCPSIPNTTQYFCDSQDPTIASLTAVDTGDGVQWYATASSTIPLNSDTALIDGMTYFADNNTGTCGARESVEVIIYGEPQGVSYQGFCITSSSQVLPTIADLFAVGENLLWYDAEIGGNVLSESTTLTDGQLYYVSQTPSGTGCETTRFSVLVSLFLVTEAPVGDSEQYFCGSSSNPPTVADILASGTNNWYSSLTASTPLNNATPLIDGATYYGTEVNAPCESDNRLAVTVTVYDENIAGDDTTLELCESDLANIGTIDLFSELNGNPDSNGVWTGDLPVSGNIVDATSMSGNNTYSFTYTVQNSTSCPEDSAIVTIVVSPTINSGENGVASFCILDAGEDLINYLGGSPDTGGTWSPALASGTGFFDPSQDSSGTYTYTVLGSGGCDASSATVDVTVFNLPQAAVFTGVQDVCANNSSFDLYSLLDGSEDITGTWLDNSNATITNPIDASSLTLGAHSFTYEVSNFCGVTSTAVTINVIQGPSSGTFTGIVDFCNPSTNLDLFTLLDGSQDSGGIWTNQSGVSVSESIDLSTLSVGTYSYSYTVTSTACDSVATEVTFTISSTDSSGVFTGSQDVCSTTSAFDLFSLLDGSESVNGTWLDSSNNTITNPIDVNTLALGTQTYTYQVNNSCGSSSTTVNFEVLEGFSSGTAINDVSYCASTGTIDLFDLLANEDTGGIWTDASNNTVASEIDITSLTAGTYNYTYKVSSASCGDNATTVTFEISEELSSGVFTGIQNVCPSDVTFDLFNLLDGSESTNGQWTDELGTVVSNPLEVTTFSAGTYTYTYTVSNTCGNSSTEVSFLIPSNFDPGTNGSVTFCSDDSGADLFDYLGGTPEEGGIWSPSLASGTGFFDPSVDAPGTYFYSSPLVSGGCFQTSSLVEVTVEQSLSSGDFVGLTTYCTSEGTIDLFDLLANEDAGGIWTDASNNTVANEINITSLTAGTYNYTYTVSSASCGDNATTVTFEISEELSSGVFTGIQNVCPSDVTFDLFNLLDGSESTNGQWTDELGTVVSNQLEVTTFSEGTYTYTYTVSNTCGNSSTEVSFLIPSNFDPGTNGSVTFCSDDSGADLFDYLGGTPEEGGIWSPSLASGTGFFDPSVDAPGTYFYSSPLVSGGCFQTSSLVEVTVEQSLSSGDFVGLTTYCTSEGTIDLFDLLVNEDTGGIWTDASNNTVSNEIDITSLTAGTYNYTYTVSSASCGDNATEISFVIDTSVANAGNFTGLIEVCNLDATFDLYTLLDGTQDEGGVWTNSNNEIVSSIITPADYNTGTNTFTYTVSGSCVSDSETVQIEILESIDMDAVTLSVDTEICYGTQALVALQNIPDGVYTITYSLSGSNTVGDQNANIAVNAGTGSFVVDESLLSNVGVTTISVTEILPQETNSCNTSSATITASFEVVEGPSIATSALSIDNVCLGNEGILTITNTNLSDGDYQLTYSLETTSGSNSYTSETISFANGDAVFNIPVDQISLTDAYLLTITSVVNLDTGCANLNTDAFITFEVTDVPDIDVDQTKLFTQNVCLGVANDVIISNPSIPDGDYIIEYEVSGVVNYSESDLIVTLIDGEAVFTIPGEVLATEGTVSVLLVNLSDGAVECPIYFTDIASATFEIYNGDMIEMEEEGNIFCEQDMPTFESLTENLINPDGEVAWYDAAVGGNMYENTDMLEPGVTYYGVYADYADCPNTERLAVTVDITYCDVIIPDGFSPNNDGVNETFTIHNLREYYPNFEIEIFNRYGNVVYKGNFDTPDWDGKTNTGAVTIGSNGVPTGVYFFVLQLHIEGRDAIQGRLYLNR